MDTLADLVPVRSDDPAAMALELRRNETQLAEILPTVEIDLTEEERLQVSRHVTARFLMDTAGAAALTCQEDCPFRMECPLFIARKQPTGRLCPVEIEYLRARFMGWMREMGRTLDTVTESERLAIGNLCSLQLELQRVRTILARARNAEMNQVSVRDVNAETGEPICWENVIHTAAQRESQILLDIRMIMKDFELTPEQKTKKAKALGLRPGNDIASRQSKLFEKLQDARRRLPAAEAPPSS
jgi:hypothetical protein